MNDIPTRKFLAFKAELEDLCLKHQVTLGSALYDSPAVFDMDERQEPIYQGLLEDHTEPKP